MDLFWHRETGRRFTLRRISGSAWTIRELIPVFEECEPYADDEGEEHTTIHRGSFDEVIPLDVPSMAEMVCYGAVYPEKAGSE